MAGNEKPERGSVPKFASFRSRNTPNSIPLESIPAVSTESKEKPREKRSHESDIARHRHREEHGRKSSRRHRSRSRGSKVPVKDEGAPPTVAPWDESPDVYVIDITGDANNLVYGTIHRYSIPQYYRRGGGSVVGLPKRYKLSRDADHERGLAITDQSEARVGRREKYVFARNERKGIKKLRVRAVEDNGPPEASLDFIHLSGHRGKKRKRAGSGSSSSSEDYGHYRSIEANEKSAKDPADKDLQYASQSSESDYERLTVDTLSESFRRRHVELSRRAESNPTSFQVWIDLIGNQDALVSSAGRAATNAERRSTADIKLSMYEKALISIGRHGDGRETLLLGMMSEGSKVWESKKLSAKWGAVLQEDPTFTRLWARYLDFVQTNFFTFRYDGVRDKFVECMDVLKASLRSAAVDQGARTALADILIYVLIRCTLFMREAGFRENATAIWQGLLEFNFYALTEHRANDDPRYDDYLAPFEEFWESEAPRIGEDGAKGWRSYATEETANPGPEPKQDPSVPEMDLEDMFGNWLAAEEKLSSVAVQPARTVDDVAEDDPYRVILFSDIKDFLAYFPRMEDRYTLLSAFLAFCRLPPLLDSNLDGQPHSSWTDPFVRTEALEQRDRFLGYTPGSAVEGVINPSGAAVEVAAEDPSYPEDRDQQTFGSRCFPAAVDTLFGQEKHWFSAFDAWKETYDTERVPVPLQWLVQALQSLALADAGGAGLAEYYLAFASKNKVSGLRKSAKALLKKYPRSLRLYNAYALIEWRSGNSTVASNIFCTALSMSGTFAEADQHDAILLWRTWIWELLQDGLTFVAWQRLLSVADGRILGESELSSSGNLDGTVKTQPAILLKARRVLEAGRDDALSSKRFDHAIHHTDLLALLTYISSSSSLDAALTIYSTTLTALQGKCPAPSLAIELLHQARARLLHHHTTTSRAFRPAVIRATLAGSIAAFPSNTIFLSLYAAAEARHNLLDRVRDTILSPPSSTSTSLIRHIFSIATAVRALPRGAGYTTNSIAAAFERALVAYPHAPGLWKLYLLFSLRHGQHGPTTLALVHRAITACPWAKGLYLFAFRSDVRAPRRELRAVYNVLGEKELRVHVDLRELLDEGYR